MEESRVNGRDWEAKISDRERKESPPISSIDSFKYWAPNVGYDIIAIVLIQAFAWAAVMAHDFESFSYLQIKVEYFFVLVMHCSQYGRIFPVNGGITKLFVGGDS